MFYLLCTNRGVPTGFVRGAEIVIDVSLADGFKEYDDAWNYRTLVKQTFSGYDITIVAKESQDG